MLHEAQLRTAHVRAEPTLRCPLCSQASCFSLATFLTAYMWGKASDTMGRKVARPAVHLLVPCVPPVVRPACQASSS